MSQFVAVNFRFTTNLNQLPEELRDANPRGVMRVVDGVWTREGIARPG